MSNGLASVIGLVGLVLVGTAAGLALGRYIFPVRPRRSSAATADRRRTPEALFAAAAAGTGLADQVAQAQARAESAEAWVDRARTWVADLQARLNDAQAAQKETRRQLIERENDLTSLRHQIREFADSKEAEMGRLESGAITALDNTIAAHHRQVADLEERLRAAETKIADHVRELVVERGRITALQSALAEREQQITEMLGKGK